MSRYLRDILGQDPRICRRILGEYGAIGRIHFATEGTFRVFFEDDEDMPVLPLHSDVEDYQERKRNGGWQKRGYVEGWVEFMDKKIAKKFVRRYNGEPIGGKKHNPFYEEIWCVKYLSKFKWDHLLEGIRTLSHYLYIQTPSL